MDGGGITTKPLLRSDEQSLELFWRVRFVSEAPSCKSGGGGISTTACSICGATRCVGVEAVVVIIDNDDGGGKIVCAPRPEPGQ